MADVKLILEGIVAALWVILQTLGYCLIASFKALLPNGVLPRKSVRDEIVLVTGAGSGLGRLMAVAFARLGARIVIWDINEAGNKVTEKMVRDIGAQIHSYTVDLSQRESIQKTADVVKREVGSVTILVNNAGIVTAKKFLQCSDALIEKTFAVNTMAHFWTTKAFIGHMIDRNHGHIVSIASMAGYAGVGTLTDYCASKFAAVGFAESLLAELIVNGNTGVKVTTVCPTYIDTGMFTGAEIPSPHVFPLLQPEYVVDCIMEAVLTDREILMLPRAAYWVVYAKGFLPTKAYLMLCDYYGVSHSMDHFVGRKNIK